MNSDQDIQKINTDDYLLTMATRSNASANDATRYIAKGDFARAASSLREAGAWDVAFQLLSAAIVLFKGDLKDVLPYELTELMERLETDGRDEFGAMGVHYVYAALQDEAI
jgi:hypothetical protein